ncbi:MAG TPA: PVC-type heme-binding CxxCH protein [Prosthecobacter sp.]|nr:PVC-type heme-binding CxxCH protein [Prosthecobacter sp.]
MAPCMAADGIATKTTYSRAYGPTNNAVAVDPAKDLPRYPAVEPKDAVKTWQVKKGFKLELAAHEPQVRDPIAICFDERGRMFVCEMIDYSEMRDVTPHLGRVSMLEDKDGDGYFETSTVFADDLPWPTGLTWANGGLFVGATPDIWRFEDKDGDGKAEVREKVYTGFGTGLQILNVQGLMNSFQWGQDNKIHVLAGGGNRGKVKCLKRGELPEQELGGRDFWFDPLTYEFGLESGGAQYGMSFDNYGRKFGCSNSDHLQYWVYDGRYAERNPYYTMPPARKSIAVDGGAAEVFRLSPDEPWRIIRTRWRIAGVVKGAVEGGGRVSGYFTGATGTTIYRGDAYGADFVNNSFSGDAGGQLVHRKIIRYAENGIDLIGERPADERGFEFAASKDTWVRVVNFANAPDGCLYVCDMYREVIEHPWSIPDEIKRHIDLNSGNDRGRLWRVEPEGWQRPKGEERQGNIAKATPEELVKMLGHPNGWHRDTAARLLYERQDKKVVRLLQANLGGNALARIHGLSVLAGLKGLNSGVIASALEDEDAFVREWALQLAAGLNAGDRGQLLPKAAKMLEDQSPRVQFQALMSLPDLVEAGGEASVAESVATKAAQTRTGEWLNHAICSLPPAQATAVLGKLAEGKHAPVAGLLTTVFAHAKGSELQKWVVELSTRWPTSSAIKAAAVGLRRAGTSFEKVDEEGKLAAVFQKAATTAGDVASPERARLEAIELLALAGKDLARAPLIGCLKGDNNDAVQSAAVVALGDALGNGANELVLVAWTELKPKARESALNLLLGRDPGAVALLEAIGTGKGPSAADLPASQVQALVKHKNTKVAELAKTALAAVIPPSREEVTKKFRPAVAAKGDAAKGQVQFMARCFACHRANGQGMAVGPDMVTVKTKGRDGLLTAILEPHKEVAAQFIAYNVVTKDGQNLTGIIAQDDANSLALKMMGGIETTIQRANIKGNSSSGQSLMPEGLEQGMSVEDMADLLSFIEAVK